MSIEFFVCIVTLFLFAGIGMPIAYAIMIASLTYLLTGGNGVGIMGKVLMDGLYQSFILLAVPLFVPVGRARVPSIDAAEGVVA